QSTQHPPTRTTTMLRHFRSSILPVYQRIFSVVFVPNAIGLVLLLRTPVRRINLDHVATFASTNLLISILVRQDLFINCIFRTAWLVPWSVPLMIRRIVARVYTYGGIHSGAALAGTFWYMAFTALLTIRSVQNGSCILPIIICTWLILLFFILILIFSYPRLRDLYHNTFEMTHRFLGWLSVLLFWIQIVLLAHQSSTASSQPIQTILTHNPTFWNLLLITILLIYPWTHLRKWTFTPTRLSSHALLLQTPHPIHRFSCLSISASPLREWHPFATFPSTSPTNPSSTTLLISAAGNWTKSLVASPRTHFWIKGHPKAGVLSLSCLFPRVLILTTGSGIGPALSSLLDRPATQHARLVWATRNPLSTFGLEIMRLVEEADREAVVIDTDAMGRPDLVDVGVRVAREMRAEAVFVLSNREVTGAVVRGLEGRGVVAYGPIWDS
ncbi:hypothetical protein P154DRAFT_386771, partial [Amniculicola lignicola CBS 123094]